MHVLSFILYINLFSKNDYVFNLPLQNANWEYRYCHEDQGVIIRDLTSKNISLTLKSSTVITETSAKRETTSDTTGKYGNFEL